MVVISAPDVRVGPSGVAAPAAIKLRGIAHAYTGTSGTLQALSKIDFSVARGSFVAVLGPSGCGKTTLLRAISGLLALSNGEVQLDGASPAAARKRRAIGWLAQEDGLLPWMSVRDNVNLPYRVGGVRGSNVLEVLRRVGLEDSARRYPHELSGGMRQRAALARALVSHPSYLLLDEPFAHLDELTRERLGGLLLELRAEYAPTTVLVTHSVQEAVRLADRVVVLSPRPGHVVFDTAIDLAQPRREDQPRFGALVRQLKSSLGFPIL